MCKPKYLFNARMLISTLLTIHNRFSYRGTSDSCANKIGFIRCDNPGYCCDRRCYTPDSPNRKSQPVTIARNCHGRFDRNDSGGFVSPFFMPYGHKTPHLRGSVHTCPALLISLLNQSSISTASKVQPSLSKTRVNFT